MAKFKSPHQQSSSTFESTPKQPRIPKAQKCEKKLAKAKERRLKKHGSAQVKDMSGTTRKLFVRWGHRVDEIRHFISNLITARIPLTSRRDNQQNASEKK